MRKVKQFRYYDDTNENNSPTSAVISDFTGLESSNAFSSYTPIIKLGVQGLPGTQFYLNESSTPITVGYTGIYEIDLVDLTTITGLRFSVDSLNRIASDENAVLVVDIMYEGSDS